MTWSSSRALACPWVPSGTHPMHAFIQSLIHATCVIPWLPAMCCPGYLLNQSSLLAVSIRTKGYEFCILLNNLTPNMTRAPVALTSRLNKALQVCTENKWHVNGSLWTLCHLSRPKHSAQVASIQLCTDDTSLCALGRISAGYVRVQLLLNLPDLCG